MPTPVIVLLAIVVVVGALKLFTWAVNRLTARRLAKVEALHAWVTTEFDLLPQDRQNTRRAAPAPELDAARAAADRDDWQACAAMLADADGDWDGRYRLVTELADAAAESDDWLRAWRAERPQDADAAVVHADALVKLAWNVRGAATADRTSQEQFNTFHRLLGQAREAAAEAQRLAPQDPTPWITELWIALGLGYSAADFERVWAGVTARDPHSHPGHYAALQYWCAKWHGSEEEAREFADRAAGRAPAGSLLAVLRLVALHEHEPDGGKDAYYGTPYAAAALETARSAADAAPAGDPHAAEIRHLLAWCYTATGRAVEALDQFKLVDGYVDALPWRYVEDPAAYYCRIRALVVRSVVRSLEQKGARVPEEQSA
ncbi:hypothetical protein [Kitasatospora sp. NPDC056181]|uniref:hypothetical protein n=1 Tax=Kitasatospora sp. NPDC056181 TaxID=3345737 RepID=UPI0035E1DA24